MKIPSGPLFKELFPTTNKIKFDELEFEHNALIKKLEDTLHNKRAEICALRETIKDLEENLDNCKYEMEKMQLILTKEGL